MDSFDRVHHWVRFGWIRHCHGTSCAQYTLQSVKLHHAACLLTVRIVSSLDESEEVFTPRLQMSELTSLEKSFTVFQKMILVILPRLPIMLAIMLEMLPVRHTENA